MYPSAQRRRSSATVRSRAWSDTRIRGIMPPRERRVERERGWREVQPAGEGQRVLRAVLAVHARVLPLDRQGPRVARAVERADERLEVDVAAPRRDEVPAALGRAEVQVRAEDRAAAVERHVRVLDVDVVDPVGELVDERGRVEELV